MVRLLRVEKLRFCDLDDFAFNPTMVRLLPNLL